MRPLLRKANAVVLVLALTAAVSALAAEKKPNLVVTDPAKAGPDFAVQGEYTGTINDHGKEIMYGGQIIALATGSSMPSAMPAGCPARAGTAARCGRPMETQGRRVDHDYALRQDGGGQGRRDHAYPGDKPLGTRRRFYGKARTLGANAAGGRRGALFDSTSADKFKGGA